MLKKATLKGKVLTLQIKTQKPKQSASGKTDVVASTHGAKPTGVLYEGKQVYAVANAFVFKPTKKPING